MSLDHKFHKVCQQYFERFAYYQDRLIKPLLPTDTHLIIVIPCYDESNLLATFESLAQNESTVYPVEVITVINQSENANPKIQTRNEQTFQEAQNWIQEHKLHHLSFQLLYEKELPKKHAGVGLARKIGMDEALRRFQEIGINGGIVCLDADCQVERNYLKALEEKFQNPEVRILSLYFEHQLDQHENLNKGIIFYELFLRYYVQVLKFTTFPHAFHTVGSSMAIRAETYALGGGMNRRKAGEDFYFMHKMASMGGHDTLNTTCVYPSARISERVPFGTGKAQQKWLEQNSEMLMTYDWEIFTVLKNFLEKLPQFYESAEKIYDKIPKEIQGFISKEVFQAKILEIKRQTKGYETFYKRFFNWWDGLKMLQCVHFLRDNFYPNQDIMHVTDQYLKSIQYPQHDSLQTPQERLCVFRGLDQKKEV